MNYNNDTGQIDTLISIDTTTAPPLGGANNSLQIIGTGALILPIGTTGEEPANGAGQVRWNSTTTQLEVNNGAAWINYLNKAGDTMSGDLAMGGNDITGLASSQSADPTSATSKGYVDALAQGISGKPSARCATAAALPTYTYANGTLGVGATLTATVVGILTVDTHAVVLNDVVLVKDETGGDAPYNGLYVCTTEGTAGVAYVLTRHIDMDQTGEFAGGFIFVQYNATGVNSATSWLCTNVGNITVGGTNVTFTQFSGAGSYSGTTNQITLTGSVFSLSTSIITPGSFTASPNNANVVLSPTGTGIVTINPATLGSINNVTVGAVTANTGRFTTVESTIATGTAPFIVASTTQVSNLNAATAGTAGSATNVGVTDNAVSAATWYPTFVSANTGNLPITVDSGVLTFVPSTGTLASTVVSASTLTSTVATGTAPFTVTSTTQVANLNAATAGTATSATNVGITDNAVSAATWYPTFVSANTGNLPSTVDSSALTFVPSTGTLTSTAVSASTLTSTVATGTAPFTVTSTTQVANLNASQLIGATWASPAAIGSTTPAAGTFTTLTSTTGNYVTNGNFVTSGDARQGTYILRNVLESASFTGTIVLTDLTTSAVTGTITVGQVVAGVGVTLGTTIISQTSGVPGGAGVYVVSASQSVGPVAMTTTQVELFLDGVTATQRLVMQNNSVYTFNALISGRRTDTTGGGAGYSISGVFRKDATSASTTLIGAVSKSILGETNIPWNATVVADTINGSIKILVTGETTKTIRWVAAVTTSEVTN